MSNESILSSTASRGPSGATQGAWKDSNQGAGVSIVIPDLAGPAGTEPGAQEAPETRETSGTLDSPAAPTFPAMQTDAPPATPARPEAVPTGNTEPPPQEPGSAETFGVEKARRVAEPSPSLPGPDFVTSPFVWALLGNFDRWVRSQVPATREPILTHLQAVPEGERGQAKARLAGIMAVAEATNVEPAEVRRNWETFRIGFAQWMGGGWPTDPAGFNARMLQQGSQGDRGPARGPGVAGGGSPVMEQVSGEPNRGMTAPPTNGVAPTAEAAPAKGVAAPSQPAPTVWKIDPATGIKWEFGAKGGPAKRFMAPLGWKGEGVPKVPDVAKLQDTNDPILAEKVERNARVAERLARMHYWQAAGSWLRWSQGDALRRAEFDRIQHEHPEMTGQDIRNGMADAAKMDFTRETDDKGHPFPDANVLSNGEIVVRPALALDEAAWARAVQATTGSPAAKARAIAKRIAVRDEIGEDLHDALLGSEIYKEWWQGTSDNIVGRSRRRIPGKPGQPDWNTASPGELVERFRRETGGSTQALMQMGSGAESAFHGIGKSFWGFMDFLGIGGADYAQTAAENERRAARIAEGLGGRTWLNKISSGVVGLAPAVATSGTLGWAGKLAGLNEAAASDLVFRGMIASQLAQSTGSAYEDAKDAELTPAKARGIALMYSVPEAIITRLFGKTGVEALAARGVTERGFAQGLKAIGEGAVKELPQQVLTAVAQAPAQTMINPNYNLPQTLLEQAQVAPVLGGAMQGVAHAGRLGPKEEGAYPREGLMTAQDLQAEVDRAQATAAGGTRKETNSAKAAGREKTSPLPSVHLISKALQMSGAPLRARLELVNAAVDTVHITPEKAANYRVIPNSDPTTKWDGLFVPEKKVIYMTATAKWPELTYATELGHLVDWEGLGQGRGYATRGPHWMERAAPSGSEKLILDWQRAVESTAAVKALREAQQQFAHDPEVMDVLNYLLEPEELFSRTYAQMIASEASGEGGGVLRQQIREARDYSLNAYWSTEDFAPVLTSLQKLLKDKN